MASSTGLVDVSGASMKNARVIGRTASRCARRMATECRSLNEGSNIIANNIIVELNDNLNYIVYDDLMTNFSSSLLFTFQKMNHNRRFDDSQKVLSSFYSRCKRHLRTMSLIELFHLTIQQSKQLITLAIHIRVKYCMNKSYIARYVEESECDTDEFL